MMEDTRSKELLINLEKSDSLGQVRVLWLRRLKATPQL
jgi:hypothetical protein